MQHIEKPGDSNKNTDRPRSVYIATYGCQMNVRDSEVIAGLLSTNDYRLTTNPDEADVIIFNTCSVRQHAEDKAWSEIGRIAKQRKIGRVPLIGLIGCMAQNYKENVFTRSEHVDFVVGPADIDKIPGIIDRLMGKSKNEGQSPFGDSPSFSDSPHSGTVPVFEMKIWETDGQRRPEEIYLSGYRDDPQHAYVVISEGCSNYCSYCVVPYVRGALRHRLHKDLIREIKQAVDSGIVSITLLGQNVNSYNSEEVDFIKLIEKVNAIDGLESFSFITSHPKDVSADFFKAMAQAGKLKKYLHLPVQSGSDRILKAMNRGYTRAAYLELVANYRKIIPTGEISTDIIVGFPGESNKDFTETFDLVKQVEFDSAFIFKYSPRPQTVAANLPDDVEKEEKEKRHARILEIQKKISKEKHAHTKSKK